MTDRELMQMALDALEEAKENVMDWGSYASEYFKTKHGLAQDIFAIENISEALRARLAQPEQEPIKYEEWNYDPMTGKPLWGEQPEPEPVAYDVNGATVYIKPPVHNGKYLTGYTAPPQRGWQTLTENEIKHLWYEACQTNLELTSQLIVHLARNIEAKLKEKNT